MAYTLSTLKIRNPQYFERVRNALNQGQTVTQTFTVGSALDLANGVIGTLAATTASTFPAAEINPIGTDGRNLLYDTVSN